MAERKYRRLQIDLTPVQVVWLHSHLLFQKIEQQLNNSCFSVQFYKLNDGIEIRVNGSTAEDCSQGLTRASEELSRVVSGNDMRLLQISLDKDEYIRIAKEARVRFQRSYITFVHYETVESLGRRMREKFGIESVEQEAQRLRRMNPRFCYLVAQKDKFQEILKYTVMRAEEIVLERQNKQVPKSQPLSLVPAPAEQTQEQPFPNLIEQSLLKKDSSILIHNLTAFELNQVKQLKKYCGVTITTTTYVGSMAEVRKRLYYANRLQLSFNYYMQPIYAYSILQNQQQEYELLMVTDRRFRKLSDILQNQCILAKNKIEILVKIAKIIVNMHRIYECYSDLTTQTVLLDDQDNVFLSANISKSIPPRTNGLLYDIHQFLMLIYHLFTETQLPYSILLDKMANDHYFCSFSHRCDNPLIGSFLHEADILFAGSTDLPTFLSRVEGLTLA